MEIQITDGEQFCGTPLHKLELALRYDVLLKPVGLERWDHFDREALHVTTAMTPVGGYVDVEVSAAAAAAEQPIPPSNQGGDRVPEMEACLLFHPKPDEPRGLKTGQLLQMAVRTQRRGTGAALVRRLIQEARARGFGEITCHARHYAIPFYAKLGFQEFGDRFEEVGMEHAHMRLVL
jgi:GNAT superfamily N-acetyltransferase